MLPVRIFSFGFDSCGYWGFQRIGVWVLGTDGKNRDRLGGVEGDHRREVIRKFSRMCLFHLLELVRGDSAERSQVWIRRLLLVALTRVVLGLAGNVCWGWGLGQSNERRKDV